MNFPMVKRLILKDLYLHRVPIAGLALALPAAGLAAVVYGGETMWRHMGFIALNNALIYLIFFLPMATIMMERKNRTLPFVMSLPVSYKEYTTSKLLGSLAVFAVTGGGIALALPLMVERSEKLAQGVLPLLVAILGSFGVFFILTLGVCLVTESFLWTMVLGLLSVVFVFLFFPLLESLPPHLIEHWKGEHIVWDPEVVATLGLQLLISVAALAATFALQKRKKDFL